MNNESVIMKRIQLALSNMNIRLLRNNIGLFYTKAGFPIRCGLANGSGDLIGWKTIIITKDMIGKKVAVFTSIEVKTESGSLKPQQMAWMRLINNMGGIGICARTPEEAEAKINESMRVLR